MKNIYFIICLLILAACSTYESGYQDLPLIIDGSSSDWNTTLESKNTGISHGISNDTEYLYIRLNISDTDIQKKILMAGLTIWIDTCGKKKESLGIICPIQKAPARINQNAMKSLNNPPKFNKDQILEAEFIGFKESVESYYIDNNPYEIKVSIDIDEFRSMYYEMRIPLLNIYKNYTDLSLKSLSIGFETGAIKMPNQDQMSANMGGGRSGGMDSPSRGKGGGRSGGMGGKPGGMSGGIPNQSSIINLTSPTKFWIKNIQLAQFNNK